MIKRFICYHGTLSKKADNILKNGFNLPEKSHKNDHWLGHGIYFFDNHFLADNWAATKLKAFKQKNRNCKDDKAILSAELESDSRHICDLDNPAEALKYNQAVESYSALVTYNKVHFDFSAGLDKSDEKFESKIKGRMACFYHDLYAKDYNIYIMIYTFKKRNARYGGSLNKINNKGNTIFIEYSERQYCVFNKEVIKNISLCKEDYDIC